MPIVILVVVVVVVAVVAAVVRSRGGSREDAGTVDVERRLTSTMVQPTGPVVDEPVVDEPVVDEPADEVAPLPTMAAVSESEPVTLAAGSDGTDQSDEPDLDASRVYEPDLSRFGAAPAQRKPVEIPWPTVDAPAALHLESTPAESGVEEPEQAEASADQPGPDESVLAEEPVEPAVGETVEEAVETALEESAEDETEEPDEKAADENVTASAPGTAEEPVVVPEVLQPVAEESAVKEEVDVAAPESEESVDAVEIAGSAPDTVGESAEDEPAEAAEPATAEAAGRATVEAVSVADDDVVIDLVEADVTELQPEPDPVDQVLNALINRARQRNVGVAEVAAELVEQAALEDREVDEVLADLVVRSEDDGEIHTSDRLTELTFFNDAVPRRPGELSQFERLGGSAKKRVIIRVLCLLVAQAEDNQMHPREPRSEAETRAWPLARAIWPVQSSSDEDDSELDLPARPVARSGR